MSVTFKKFTLALVLVCWPLNAFAQVTIEKMTELRAKDDEYQTQVKTLTADQQKQLADLDARIAGIQRDYHETALLQAEQVNYCNTTDNAFMADKDMNNVRKNAFIQDRMEQGQDAIVAMIKDVRKIGFMDSDLVRRHLEYAHINGVRETAARIAQMATSGDFKTLDCKKLQDTLNAEYQDINNKRENKGSANADTEAQYEVAKKDLSPEQLSYLDMLDKEAVKTVDPNIRIFSMMFRIKACVKSGAEGFTDTAENDRLFAKWRTKVADEQQALWTVQKEQAQKADFIDQAILAEHMQFRGKDLLRIAVEVMQTAEATGAFEDTDCPDVKKRLVTLDTSETAPKASK